MPSSPIYIPPSATMHPTFADAAAALDRYGFFHRKPTDAAFDAATIARENGPRILVVGEPGVGKSLMIDKIREQQVVAGADVFTIELRGAEAIRRIDAELAKPVAEGRQVLLLDGLDEVPSRLLYDVLRKISEVSAERRDITVVVSSRWVFVKRYASHFADFRILAIHPFSIAQVRQYLESSDHSPRVIDKLLERVSFGHRTLILQIPRYLYYLAAYVTERGVDAAATLSRNDLFEHFIYRKLELEDRKLSRDKRALVKRLLEKLALVMEILQVNVITADDLMTFFDELDSDLKRTAMAQLELELLYDCSLLRVSHEGLEKVEFENAEFQEYLAAKEITRFADPNPTAFGFAVDADTNEIRPSWYNTLTFLVDIQPPLFEPIIEFSGLSRDDFKVIDEGFFTFLSRLDPNQIAPELRTKLFRLVLHYHAETRQWLSGRMSGAMPALYDPSLEAYLRASASEAESKDGDRRLVGLANIAETVGVLLDDRRPLDRPFWASKLIEYALDDNENGVLQRHALKALAELGDSSVIDSLQAVSRKDELVERALLEACIQLDPDHPATLKLILDGVAVNDIYARRGLYRLRKPESIGAFFSRIVDDPGFRHGLLQGASIFEEEDASIAGAIARVLTDELRELGKNVLVRLLQTDSAHYLKRSSLLPSLWKALSPGDPDFAADLVRRIMAGQYGKGAFFSAHGLFAAMLEQPDIAPFFQAMRDADDERGAIAVMHMLRHSGRPGAETLYEAGRAHAPEGYARWEAARSTDATQFEAERRRKLLSELRVRLQPEPGKFRQDVFQYYNQHVADLAPLLETADRERIAELIYGTIFKFEDPASHALTIKRDEGGGTTFTTSSGVYYFEDAAETALHLGLDVTAHRARILSLIPFTYDLRTIFALVPEIQPGELDRVLAVYQGRDSDLWRHRPQSLVEAVSRYRSVEAVPVLLALVAEPAIDMHAREQALVTSESLSPNAALLRNVFEQYRRAADSERGLAEAANTMLITSHQDADAIRWRLAELEARVAPITKRRSRRARVISSLEDEISFERSFAQPLMKLAKRGYERDFLGLLDRATILWGRGSNYHGYAQYLWDIVYAYFDNLKESRSYEPLRLLEGKIRALKDREGANWLAHRMVGLRRAYLEQLGRPRGITDAVRRYNDARQRSVKLIRNSDDLFYQLKDAIDTDLRRWIEGEGAYRVLVVEAQEGDGRRHHEALVQKTVKTQIENILLKRGFQIDIAREEQLLDDKRVDFLVRYGFAGPIAIEIKLTSNTDLRTRNLAETSSFRSMKRYIDGYDAAHGIFLVIDNANANARRLAAIADTYQRIPKVHVQTLSCTVRDSTPSEPPRQRRPKKAADPRPRAQGKPKPGHR